MGLLIDLDKLIIENVIYYIYECLNSTILFFVSLLEFLETSHSF